MKKVILSNFLLFIIIGGFPQAPRLINFDDSVNLSRIHMDSTLPDNIWQIGQPDKTIFTFSHSVPNAIVTGLHNPYPVNNTSIFYLGTGGDTWLKYHVAYLNFYYKMDSDTINDFGKIEISLDHGNTWANIFSNYNFYQILDSLGNLINSSNSGDTVVFSGTTNGWYSIWSDYNLPNHYFDSIVYRFTFHTDNVIENRDGWMIDDISFADFWENVVDKNTAYSFSPNPAQDIINIRSKNQILHFEIRDVMGNLIYNKTKTENHFSVNIMDLKPGIYIYMMKFENGQTTTGKFLKIS